MTAVVLTHAATTQQNNVHNSAMGSFSTDAGTDYSDVFISLGFKPRKVVLRDVTDGKSWSWFQGMANPGAEYSVAAGDKTLLTSTGFTISGAGVVGGTAVALVDDPGLHSADAHTNAQGGVKGNGFTIYSTMIIASKLYVWEAND